MLPSELIYAMLGDEDVPGLPSSSSGGSNPYKSIQQGLVRSLRSEGADKAAQGGESRRKDP